VPRLPELTDRNDLPEDKRFVHDYLVETRGRVSPGFGGILNNPDVAHRIAHLGSHIRFESELPDNVRELVALVASVEMDGVYEQAIHSRDALPAGVSQDTVDSANDKDDLREATPDEELAAKFTRELTRTHHVTDETFAAVQKRFGNSGTVELIATAAYYSMLALVHNALLVGR
jgi:4-carboxymuconolactone decarboxylase